MKILLIYIFAWLGLVIIAVANGIVREKLYGQSMSELSAHQLSTLIVIILLGIYIFVLTIVFQIQSAKQAFMISSVWMIMTVIFEFVFGHFVAGQSWTNLFMDYNILNGRVWVLVLIWIFIAPYVFYRLGF